jgi:hypothetical protein
MSKIFSDYDISDRQRLTLHCVFTLQSPLSHIGEVSGNVSNLKTVKLLDLEGQSRQCFVYSGNAIRNGILRRVGVAAALSDLELQINPDAHQTMFAGGRIDGSTASDMELDKKIRQFMPWLSVLGTAKPTKVFGSKDAQMVQGRINVGSAHLICYESAAYIYNQMPGILPPEALEGIGKILEAQKAITSDPMSLPTPGAIATYNEVKAQYLPLLRKVLRTWTEFITVDQTTRRDSLFDPNLIKFLPPEAQNLLKGEGGKEKKSDQMIAGDRLVMAGAKLYSRWDLNCTAIEEGWVYQALLKFDEFPYLGGKGNRGNGHVSLDIWHEGKDGKGLLCSLGRRADAGVLSDRFQEQHGRYREYINQYQQFLESVKDSSELRNLLGA